MKKLPWIILFLLVLATNLVAAYFDNRSVQFISKALLMPALAIYFLTQTRPVHSTLKAWILLALSFSWAGDILLAFEERNGSFFLLGLSAFLVVQVFYIIFFHRIRVREYIRGNELLLLLVVVYYSILISLLSPHLGKMKLPVRIYGVVLSFMLMLAMHTILGKKKRAGWWMMAGAILFVASDSLLAFNKFLTSFNYADMLVMLTYGVGQLCIIEGAVVYISARTGE